MERDWGRLAGALANARKAAGLTQDELAAMLGVGRSSVQKLERGHVYARVLPVHRAAARVLGWTEGSVDAVLGGGDPSRAPKSPEAAPVGQPTSTVEEGAAALLDDLTARVKGALLGGPVVDATAVPMSDGGDVVIIWTGGEEQELTPAQRRRLEQQWHRIQRAAHDILADDEEQEE